MSQIDLYTEQSPASGDSALGVTSGGETRRFTLSELMPAGTLIDFAGATAPDGFLSCDGSAISRTTYSDLFTAIGTTWGVGDGSTTFNIPDLRGLGVRGAGSHGSATKADGTAFAGPAVGSIENDQMQQITGQANDVWSGSYDGTGAFLSSAAMASNRPASGAINSRRLVFDSADSAAQGGARTGDETRGAAAGVLKCIKT